MTASAPSDALLWTPSDERRSAALITDFEAWLAREGAARGLPSSLADLHKGWRQYAAGV